MGRFSEAAFCIVLVYSYMRLLGLLIAVAIIAFVWIQYNGTLLLKTNESNTADTSIPSMLDDARTAGRQMEGTDRSQ